MKINLGSGPNSAKGWTNYDWGLLPFLGKYRLLSIFVKLNLLPKSYDCKWPEIKLVDIRGEFPEENNSVEYIYCSNVLEHFNKNEMINILKECKRVLKKNGTIRLVLPDLKKLISNYKSADTFNREYLGFDKDLYVGIMGKIKVFFIRGHQWMYDTKSFKTVLEEIGFKDIKELHIREGSVPNLDVLDLEVHKKLCFYYECKKA